jgi:hypothetical protein
MPPALLATADHVPCAILRSALVNPLTSAENMIVTGEVLPAMTARGAGGVPAPVRCGRGGAT